MAKIIHPSMPDVTVGMIPYNGQETVAAAIESILSQSFTDFELLISDDASSDNSVAICRKYAAKDSRIRIYVQKKNLGLSGNSNFVLKHAKGSYFMWAADDDLWDKDYIRTLHELLQKYPRAALAATNCTVFREDMVRESSVTLPYCEYAEGESLYRQFFTHPALLVWGLFRIEKLRNAGGFHADPRPFFKGSDFVTVSKVFLHGGLAFTQEKMLYKRDTGMTLRRFEILSNHEWSVELLQKIGRYLTYPFMFLFDAAIILYFFLRSDLDLKIKEKVIGYVGKWFIDAMIEYLRVCVKGVFSLFFRSLHVTSTHL